MQLISSRAHPFFKQLVKLEKSTKQRKTTGITLLDGIHLIQAYHSEFGAPQNLIIKESSYQCTEIQQLLQQINKPSAIKVVIFSDALFTQLSPVKTPTGIMALIAIPEAATKRSIQQQDFCVLLETVQDPGNLGSILRSAAAAGVSDIYLSPGCTDAWSPKTLRAAMGAHFLLTIHQQSDLTEKIQQFHGSVIATSLHATKNLYQIPLTGPVAFVFGNEGNGLSDKLLQIIKQQIIIPMPGKTESLNIATAVAICLFERVRQTLNKP